MEYLCVIENDLFDISNSIKNIDRDYVIYRNMLNKKFELHNTRYSPTLQVVLPFDELDMRTIDYAVNTRVENIKKVAEEMEKENNRLEKENDAKMQNDILERVENVYRGVE